MSMITAFYQEVVAGLVALAVEKAKADVARGVRGKEEAR